MTRPFHHEFDLQVRRSVLPTAEKAVLFVLNSHADPKGFVARRYAPSMNRLASETSLSRRRVITAVKACEAEGWLVVHRPPIEQARTEHVTNAYELVIPASAHGALDGVARDGASAPGALGVVHDMHGAGAQGALKSAQPSPESFRSYGAAPARPVARSDADRLDAIEQSLGGFEDSEEEFADEMLDRYPDVAIGNIIRSQRGAVWDR